MKAKLAAIALGAFVLIPTIKASPRWDERFTQIEQSIRDWYKAQEMNPATWERLGSPSWKSCCEKGDVFHIQFRVINNGTKYGEDTWWYEKDGKWKQVPPDTIHWGNTLPMVSPPFSSTKTRGRSFASARAGMGNDHHPQCHRLRAWPQRHVRRNHGTHACHVCMR